MSMDIRHDPDAQLLRLLLAGVAMHALISRESSILTQEEVADRAFAVADRLIERIQNAQETGPDRSPERRVRRRE